MYGVDDDYIYSQIVTYSQDLTLPRAKLSSHKQRHKNSDFLVVTISVGFARARPVIAQAVVMYM